MSAATTPDAIAAALVTLLQGVGSLGTVTNRTPDTPFQGWTPVVVIRPIQNVHGHTAGSVRVAGAKFDQGILELRYRDAPLAQQQAVDPERTQAQIEDALVANRDAIVAAIDANRTLSGAVTNVGEDQGIAEAYNPDGYSVEWDAATWLGMDMMVPYLSLKMNLPPLTP